MASDASRPTGSNETLQITHKMHALKKCDVVGHACAETTTMNGRLRPNHNLFADFRSHLKLWIHSLVFVFAASGGIPIPFVPCLRCFQVAMQRIRMFRPPSTVHRPRSTPAVPKPRNLKLDEVVEKRNCLRPACTFRVRLGSSKTTLKWI